MTAEIPLTRGYVALVDDEDAARVLAISAWYAEVHPRARTVYAAAKSPGTRRTIHMHSVVTGWSYVDHVDGDGDGLNNRRANLRPATQTQNNGNARRRRDNTSGYKGVYFDARRGHWAAQISIDGRRLHLGVFADPVDAARRYDAAAVYYFGEFARPNFPEAASIAALPTWVIEMGSLPTRSRPAQPRGWHGRFVRRDGAR